MKVKKVLLASFLVLSLALPPIQPRSRAYAQDTVEYWAVIVGVADYQHFIPQPIFPSPTEDYDLEYPDDDARSLYNKLSPIWGADHIKLLVDSEATKAGIQNAICDWLDPKEDANDVVLFFFSGHGAQSGGHEYICPYDAVKGLYASDIRDNVLDSWLDNLDSGKLVVILDSCHSGGFIGELSQSDRVILTACGNDESAWAYPVLEHGLFSYYILEAFSDLEAVNNGDDTISAEEIFNYVKPKVVSYNYEYQQHPELYDGYSGEIGLFNVGVVTFDASPQVTSITIDGKEYRPEDLPITFTWVTGTAHTFSVSSSALDDGTEYIFTSWSDGNTEVTRTITISGLATYTANYEVPLALWPYIVGFVVLAGVVASVLLIKRRKKPPEEEIIS